MREKDRVRLKRRFNKLKVLKANFLDPEMLISISSVNPRVIPEGCGGTGHFHHGCAKDTSVCYRVNMDQNL